MFAQPRISPSCVAKGASAYVWTRSPRRQSAGAGTSWSVDAIGRRTRIELATGALEADGQRRDQPDEHQRASLVIERSLEQILEALPPQTLSAYWPYKGEVDLRPLLERLQGKGWITALPFVVWPRKPLDFYGWTVGDEMDPGVYGIPVPRARVAVRPGRSVEKTRHAAPGPRARDGRIRRRPCHLTMAAHRERRL